MNYKKPCELYLKTKSDSCLLNYILSSIISLPPIAMLVPVVATTAN